MTDSVAGRGIILAETPYRDLRDAHFEVALLPWGATEPHNLHLPYGTDIVESTAIASASALLAAQEGAQVAVLPPIPFGVNTGQMDLPLTINMNPSTQLSVLEDVASSIDAHGIPKFVILNGHGGNDFRQMIREIQAKHRTYLCTVDWFRSVNKARFFEEPGDHADEMETSLMMHIAPRLVLPLEESGRGSVKVHRIRAFREGWAWAPRPWTKVSADSGAGNPRKATAEKGSAYFTAVTRAIADFLVALSAADIKDLYV
jgi:creatinine amidohydrolase